jgi:ribosome-associated toxin RatA of RatAB toxin-antitoxin module
MPTYEGSHETTLRASPEEVWAVMTDYDHLPEWQGPLKRSEVLSRYPDGRAREVRYEIDVKLRSVVYTLRHSYEHPTEIAGEYVEGDLACLEGRWRFEPTGHGGTRVRFDLRIDPGLPIPGPVQRMLHDRVLRSSVEDLRRRMDRPDG